MTSPFERISSIRDSFANLRGSGDFKQMFTLSGQRTDIITISIEPRSTFLRLPTRCARIYFCWLCGIAVRVGKPRIVIIFMRAVAKKINGYVVPMRPWPAVKASTWTEYDRTAASRLPKQFAPTAEDLISSLGWGTRIGDVCVDHTDLQNDQ